MDYVTMIIAVLFGVMSGIFTSIVGLTKTVLGLINTGKPKEKLDYRKMVQTIILGAIIGGFAGYKGIEFSDAELLFYACIGQMGLTAIFDQLLKICSRSFVRLMFSKKKVEKDEEIVEEE